MMLKPPGYLLFLGSLVTGACATTPGAGGGDDAPPDPDAVVTISDDGFLVDGELRWSSTAAPEVHGTVADPATTVDVMAGDVSLGSATVDGSSWKFAFPTDALALAPTEISFVARVGEGAQAVVQRSYAIDTTPPALGSLPSTILSELGDTPVFAPDGAIVSHPHGGPAITLGANATDCPDVFKHAYLMHPGDANPIRWRLTVDDDGIGIDPASVMVRFGVQGGAFGPWRPATDAAGVVEVDAVRSGPSGDAFVANVEGKLVVQLSATDRFGRTATVERCWTNHPLAPPLHATSPVEAKNHPFALNANRLGEVALHNLAAELINPDSSGLSVMDYELANATEDPAFVTFTLDRPQVTTRRNYVRQSALKDTSFLLVPLPCNSSPLACIQAQHPALVANTGTLKVETPDHYTVRVFRLDPNGDLVDEVPAIASSFATGTFRFELAGRAGGATPARYRISTGLRRLATLIPGGAPGDPAPASISEATIVTGASTTDITGELIGPLYAGCIQVNATQTACTRQQTFQHYRALSRIELSLGGPLGNQPAASPTLDIVPRSLGLLSGPRRLAQFAYESTETLPQGF